MATTTDGAVVNSGSDLSVLTNTIIERYDSLPRVEENSSDEILPIISDVLTEQISENTMKISWQNTGVYTMVVLNDAILGITDQNNIAISELDLGANNSLRLIPLAENVRGNGVEIELGIGGRGEMIIPKAPNTGRR